MIGKDGSGKGLFWKLLTFGLLRPSYSDPELDRHLFAIICLAMLPSSKKTGGNDKSIIAHDVMSVYKYLLNLL